MTDVTDSLQHNETDVVMAAEWDLQPPDYAPKARTQLFDIHDAADVMLENFCNYPRQMVGELMQSVSTR